MIRFAERSDIPAIAAVLQHPDVGPYVGADECSGCLEERIDKTFPRFVYVLHEDRHGVDCVFQFERVSSGPLVWNCHVAVLPEARGRVALGAAREALEMMNAGGARYFNAFVRNEMPEVQMFARLLGFRLAPSIRYRIDRYRLSEGRWFALKLKAQVKNARR